jgi:hypothetical protein
MTTMKRTITIALFAAVTGGAFACSTSSDEGGVATLPPSASGITREAADKNVASWPEVPRKVAMETMDKYGPPDEMMPSMILWNARGPWKRTIVFRDEVAHEFPAPHTDVLQQFIDYRVPPDRYDDLATYDGSVIVERTKGELSARCDLEAANFLALNLAVDILNGKNVDEARQDYANKISAYKVGSSDEYTRGLRFMPQSRDAADKDERVVPNPLE